MALRLKVVQARQIERLSYAELGRRFNLNYHTVRTWCKRFESQGISGLSPSYSNCGRSVCRQAHRNFRLVRLLKHLHPTWGVPYILARIKEDYPMLELQGIRHYQRLLQKASDKAPKPTLPRSKQSDRPRQAHDEWEVDAKERITLAGGQKACYLNVTDSKSSAILKCKAFPPLPNQPGPHWADPTIDARTV